MKQQLPMLIVNLKTYERGSGEDALEIAYKCERVANEESTNIVVAAQNADIHRIAEKVEIPVFAQHIDTAKHGANTGKDVAETLAYNGADGVLINHSEDQVALETIEEAVDRASQANLQTVVCADMPDMVSHVDDFDPDFIAYEPPKLIGSDTAVTDANPDLVEDAVESANTTVFCGAGISDADDVAAAIDLGARGVLVASGVVKANHPADALRDLAAGLES